MYKTYFKQTIQILLQNKLMSIISILGTALAIMMIMSIIVSEEIKNASVAPETNRNHTYYITRESGRDSANTRSWSSSLQYDTYEKCLKNLEVPKYSSLYNKYKANVNIQGMEQKFNSTIVYTDAGYWNIFSFKFLMGRPFSREESESGMKYAVISEELSRKLVKDENPLDIPVLINNTPYIVTGVVKDVSSVFGMAHSKVWVPYTSVNDLPGSSTLLMMLDNNNDLDALNREIRERERKYSIENPSQIIELPGPVNHRIYASNLSFNNGNDLKEQISINNRKKIFIFLVLLLVPAINLSGFSVSRIKKRMAEIGVRKAFGAKKHVILIQVLFENFITSLLGGAIGLICSYIIVFRMREWLLDIPATSNIPIGTLVSPSIFVAVFAICLVINLLSAGIPAWRASRVTIVNSLHQNEKKS